MRTSSLFALGRGFVAAALIAGALISMSPEASLSSLPSPALPEAGAQTTGGQQDSCVFTRGYWRTHVAVWPVASLVLGDATNPAHTYATSELLGILGSPERGDASLILATQLIAAKLNIARGSNPAPIAEAVARADALLTAFSGRLPYGIPPRTPVGAEMITTASALEAYNAGGVPGSCQPVNQAPVADAGSDQTRLPNELAQLDGSASSDPDGDALTFAWSFVSKPAGSTATLSDSTAVNPSFVVDVVGEYEIELLVSDGTLTSAPDRVKISTANTRPVADAGADTTARVLETVTLDGSGSHDVDGDTLAFQWSIVFRPEDSTADLPDDTAVRPTMTLDRPGEYVIQLVVFDGTDASDPDRVTVSTVNSPPVANAGADQSVFVDVVTQLDGSGSTDVDGDTLTYAWSLTTRPAGSAATIENPTAVNPTFTPDVAGDYIAQLIVNDGAVDSAADTVMLTTSNRAPVADPGLPQTLPLGETAGLDGSGSRDPDGDQLTFAWALVSIPPGSSAALSDSTSVTPTFVLDLRGDYVAQLIVNDGQTNSAPATVTISTENSAPLADAGADQMVETGVTIHLDGSGSFDPDGTPIEFAWSLLSSPAGSVAAISDPSIVNPTFVADVDGVYVVQLIVGDGVLLSAADTMTVTAASHADLAIAFVNAPSGTHAPGTTVTFGVRLENAGPLAADDVTARFLLPAGYALISAVPSAGTFDIGSGNWSLGTIDAGGAAQLEVEASVNATGPLALAASITGSSRPDPEADNNSATAAPINRPPVAHAGADQSVTTGTAVTLNGGGSTDADGDALTFQWTLLSRPATSTAVLTAANTTAASFVADRTGDFIVELVVTDVHGSSTADTMTVTVTTPSANRPPVITSTPVVTGEAGQPYAYAVTATDPDPGDVLTFTLPIAPAGMTIDAVTGLVQWTPLGNQTGLNSVAVHVRDLGGLLSAQGFSVTVQTGAGNQAPIAQDDQYDARTGDSLSVAAPGVLGNDSDPDGNRLTARALTQPANGNALVNADGSFTYTPFTFQEGELVRAEHVNLATSVPGATLNASTFSIYSGDLGRPESAVDGSSGTSWLTLGSDAANFGPRSRTGALPFIEVSFPQTVEVKELQVVGHRDPLLTRRTGFFDSFDILAGEFQLFDEDGAEIYNSGSLDLSTAPHDGAVVVPDLFQRSRNAARTTAGVVYRASSVLDGSEPADAFDGDPKTQWASASGAPMPQFLEVEFPSDTAVHRVRIFGNRSSTSADFLAFVVDIFNAAGDLLFTSGSIAVTAESSDVTVTTGAIAGARRVRVTGTALENVGGVGGISELEVISTETVTSRLNGSVRRARFTDTRDNSFSVGLSEFTVIGSALIRRQAVSEPNLTQLLPTAVVASSFGGAFNPPENAIDDTTARNWYAASASPGEFIEIEFPQDVSVREIAVANPSARPDGFGTSELIQCSGVFTLLDATGGVLFDSGAVATPQGSVNAAVGVTVPVPNVTGVRRLRFTSAGCEAGSPFPPGFSEIRAFGDADVGRTPLDMRTKFQALVGREAHSTPLVANLTDDNGDGRVDTDDVPDIVVSVEAPGDQLKGEIKIVSGDDGREIATLGAPDRISPWAEPAIGDLDGDGRPDVVAVLRMSTNVPSDRLIAFDANGTVKWISESNPMPQFQFPGGPAVDVGAVAIANLDAAGPPEIVVGASVFSAEGRLLGDGRTLGGTTGGTGLRSRIPAIADIDLDGVPELVAGPTAYRLSGGALSIAWQRTDRLDGYVGIANLDDDPFAEVVIVANGFVYVLNHDGTDAPFWNTPSNAPVPIPGGGQGGAPTIADLDGDGIPEIGVAGAGYYTVFDREGRVRWKSVTSDRTSNATGATVFDLDGDGGVEVIYRDEANLRIYRGSDGVVLSKRAIGSSTWSELPVVADVDNDGHADIVVTSDNFIRSGLQQTGVHVLHDVANRWVRTRRIWNQHGYHVTNVHEDGSIPVVETPHFTVSALNSFRLNTLVPEVDEDATDRFTYVAGDGSLDSAPATVRVAVRKPNSAPSFTSNAIADAAIGVLYLYSARAADPDPGDILTFSLPSAPGGMTIDPTSGLIRWTPADTQRGLHNVTVKVQDVRGLYSLQGYTVVVGDPVAVPNVVGTPRNGAEAAIATAVLTLGAVATRHSPTAPVDVVLTQSPAAGTLVAPRTAVDLAVSLGPAPAGTVPDVVGQQTALAQIDIVAAGFTVGATTGIFSATAPAGLVLSQSPEAGTQAPTGSPIALIVSQGVPPGDRDADGDGVTGNQGDCNDTDATIYPGAVDPPGDGIDQNCNGTDSIDGDDVAPIAALASPADAAAIATSADILGTVADQNLLRYTVQFGEVDAPVPTTIGAGTEAVANGVLGRIDPTLLENGLYRVRLIAEDANGQTTVDERVYRITGGAKAGVVSIAFVDVNVPVAGVPVSVIRTYDSRVKTTGDFGVGWRLDVKRGSYRHNRTPGRGWIINDQPFLGGFLPCVGGTTETLSHFTEVRISERESYRFALSITNGNLGITGACEGTARFQFIDGTTAGARLDVLDGTGVIYLRGGADEVLDMNAYLDGELRVYDPRRVRLTTIDGRSIDFDRTDGITRIADANGSAVVFSSSGIVHSTGRSIVLTRDGAGRITTIVDPMGRELRYAYDAEGDLVEFIDQAGHRTTFRYDAAHRLIEIRDPLGDRALSTEYDAEGRLVAVIDSEGNRIELTHDLSARREVVRDARGQATVHEYDALGQVVATIDALGQRREFTYDARGNQLTERDPLGRIASRTYDAADNVVSAADFDGNVTTFTYDANRRVTAVTDPEGRTTRYAHDTRGNLVQTTDPDGGMTRFGRDDAGNVTSITDPLGHTTRSTYDSAGNLVSQTDPLGNVVTAAYDAAGQVVREDRPWAQPGAPVAVVQRSATYDAFNQLAVWRDPTGRSIAFTYSPSGRLESSTDGLGRAVRYVYDASGDQVETHYPDGSRSSTTHDAGGLVLSSTNRDGLTSRFTYDAVGRQVEVTHPDGSVEAREYDAIGRVTALEDERGGRTSFTYEPNGQVVTDALGGQTRHTFDSRRNRVAVVDALGRATTFEYDGGGRQTRMTFPDGSTWNAVYDAAGRPASIIDQAGRTTAFSHDPLGRLTGVTDPVGGMASFTYDSLGNLLSQTDAAGRLTTFLYDAGGRLISRRRPLGQEERFAYDSAGRLTEHTDFNGRSTQFVYDLNDRVVARMSAGGASTSFSYTAAGLRTRAGNETYEYDARGRIVRATTPDGSAIAYEYDAAGNRTGVITPYATTSLTYDALNRLATVVDPSGTTSLGYDAAGNLMSKSYPNGVGVAYTYDALNRLVEIRNTGPNGLISSYAYTLAADGKRTRVVEAGPATSGRTVNYSYDALGRLVLEEIDEPGAADDRTIAYEYDAVGNRLRRTVATSVELVETTYSYDNNDRLLSETTTATTNSIAAFWYGAAGLAAWPIVTVLALVACRRRRQVHGERAERRWCVRAAIVLLLAITQAFVPPIARAATSAVAVNVVQAPSTRTVHYLYDDNGNLVRRTDGVTTDTYSYDSENRLVVAQLQSGPNPGSHTFTYDADGFRTSRTSNGVTTTYLMDKTLPHPQVLAETTGASVVTYTYGLDLISQSRPGTGTRFYLFDGHGSTRQLSAESGDITDTYTFDAFGELLASTGTTANLYLYNGQQLDPNLGFYYLRARYYAQALGRFVTPDPVDGAAFDPPSLHRYLYAHADPVNNSDPSGLFSLSEVTTSMVVATVLFTLGGTAIGAIGGGLIGGGKGAAIGALIGAFIGFSLSPIGRQLLVAAGERMGAIGVTTRTIPRTINLPKAAGDKVAKVGQLSQGFVPIPFLDDGLQQPEASRVAGDMSREDPDTAAVVLKFLEVFLTDTLSPVPTFTIGPGPATVRQYIETLRSLVAGVAPPGTLLVIPES